jgi:hypothetical protein
MIVTIIIFFNARSAVRFLNRFFVVSRCFFVFKKFKKITAFFLRSILAVLLWTVEDVAVWLESHEIFTLRETFKKNAIHGAFLMGTKTFFKFNRFFFFFEFLNISIFFYLYRLSIYDSFCLYVCI